MFILLVVTRELYNKQTNKLQASDSQTTWAQQEQSHIDLPLSFNNYLLAFSRYKVSH